MGAVKRIKELEADVAYWRKAALVHDDIKHYLKTLAEMPEDAVLTYSLSGMRMQHEIGRSVRALMHKVYG